MLLLILDLLVIFWAGEIGLGRASCTLATGSCWELRFEYMVPLLSFSSLSWTDLRRSARVSSGNSIVGSSWSLGFFASVARATFSGTGLKTYSIFGGVKNEICLLRGAIDYLMFRRPFWRSYWTATKGSSTSSTVTSAKSLAPPRFIGLKLRPAPKKDCPLFPAANDILLRDLLPGFKACSSGTRSV